MASSSLGVFAKLPSEIRLMIWNKLCPSGWHRDKTDLAILRTSKQLYAEVLDQLYMSVKEFTFFIRPEFDRHKDLSYLGFEMRDIRHRSNHGETKEESPKWIFSSAEEAISRGFQYLPLHIIPCVVHIEAPDPEDPGQLVCSSLRLQQLADLLQSINKRPLSQLIIRLDDVDQWLDERSRKPLDEEVSKRNFILTELYPEQNHLAYIRSDVDAVMFPFYTLENVRAVLLDKDTANLICSSDMLKKAQTIVYDKSTMIMLDLLREVPAYIGLRNEIFKFYLHKRLDTLPGRTANMLRLDRFVHWHEHKHEENILRLMKKYPVELGFIDPGFYYTAKRYIYAHALRCLMSGGQLRHLSPNIDLRYLYSHATVTGDQWFTRFRDGLPPYELEAHNHDPFWYEFEVYFDTVTLRTSVAKDKDLDYNDPLKIDRFVNAAIDADDEQARLLSRGEPGFEDRLRKKCGIIDIFSQDLED